jgi:hypothetical protein
MLKLYEDINNLISNKITISLCNFVPLCLSGKK